MKNLKKALALVLVIVMAFSLVTIGSAKFTDDSSIKYKTAVGVMSGIGAINGYSDGSFQPKGLVTRAEAAKMVTYAILGSTVAAALSTSTSSFSDVPATHWASPFIEYCVAQGILNGRGDGTFDPNGNVTGFELAKMILAAAGYGQNDEYVGANWQINVASDAMKNGVFKSNETGNFVNAATREEAALYIFNGIYRVGQVEYNELFGYYGKGGSALTSASTGTTIAKDVYNMAKDYGVVIGNTSTGAVKTGTKIAKADLDDDGKLEEFTTTDTYKFDSTVDDMGQLFAIYSDTETDQVFYTEKLSSTVSVIIATSTPTGYNNAFGSLTFTTADEIVTFADNYNNNSYTIVDTTPAAAIGLTPGTVAPAGTYVTFEGEIVSFVAAVKTTFDKVTAISTSTGAESITFRNLGQKTNGASNDLLVEYEGIAVGDYVTIKQAGTKYVVQKVTTVDGKISAVGNFAGMLWYITLDGKQYSKSGAADSTSSGATTNYLDLGFSLPTATEFDRNTYTLYLDASGSWIASTLKSGSTATNVVYATGLTWSATGEYGPIYKAQCVNSGGEQVVYDLKPATGGGAPTVTPGFKLVTYDQANGLVTLGTNLSSVTNFTMSANTGLLQTTDVLNKPNCYYASDVKFIFVSGTGADIKITTVTGLAAVDDVIALTTADGLFLTGSGANKTITAIIVPGTYSGATTAATVYLDLDAAKDSYNATYSYYYAYVDGVSTKLTSKDTSIDSWKGQFVSYTVNSDNVYDFTGISTASNVHAQAVIPKGGVYNNYITVDGFAQPFNATGATVIDLSQAFGEPLLYTSVGSLAAASANKAFLVSFVTDATTGVIKFIYVEKSFDLFVSGAGITATGVKTEGTTTDTYRLTFSGTSTAATNITLSLPTGAPTGATIAWGSDVYGFWGTYGFSVTGNTLTVADGFDMGTGMWAGWVEFTVTHGVNPVIAVS